MAMPPVGWQQHITDILFRKQKSPIRKEEQVPRSAVAFAFGLCIHNPKIAKEPIFLIHFEGP